MIDRGGTRRRPILPVVALAAAMAVPGCSEGSPPEATSAASPPVTASPIPTTPAEPAFVAATVEELGQLCGTDRVVAEGAAAYQGDGPHPVAVFERYAGDEEYERVYVTAEDAPPGFDPATPEETALLACLAVVETGLPVGECSYETEDGTPFDVAVEGQRYEIDLYALATGERLLRDEFVADFCPPSLITFGDDIPSSADSQMTIDDMVEAFEDYVSGSST